MAQTHIQKCRQKGARRTCCQGGKREEGLNNCVWVQSDLDWLNLIDKLLSESTGPLLSFISSHQNNNTELSGQIWSTPLINFYKHNLDSCNLLIMYPMYLSPFSCKKGYTYGKFIHMCVNFYSFLCIFLSLRKCKAAMFMKLPLIPTVQILCCFKKFKIFQNFLTLFKFISG